ncbi:MAG TPA: hypothetical protein VFE51_31595 [Verrucomicrobiae bacterium]|nr:hypothetical protein [Verrucomicrobiae bacterium]
MPVALFSNPAKAQPVRDRLAQAGFAATINEGPPLSKLWFVSDRAAGIRVEVPADQYNRAEQFLLDWDGAEGALGSAIRCPECGSLRVDYPQYARHSLLTNLAMGLLAQLRVIEKDFYCEDCHFTWPKQGLKPRRTNPHSAPFYFIEGVEQTRSGAIHELPGPGSAQKSSGGAGQASSTVLIPGPPAFGTRQPPPDNRDQTHREAA